MHRAVTAALIEARHAAGMMQRDLAAKLGCLPATVANLEAGQRRIDIVELVVLARALNASPEALIKTMLDAMEGDTLVNNFSRSTRG